MTAEWLRWNTHHSTTVEVELFGQAHDRPLRAKCHTVTDPPSESPSQPLLCRHSFRLKQDPNSNDLGTTVWDASIVFGKFIEKNARRGDYSRQRLRGKRVLELGAGMGLCSLALAVQGAHVIVTDLAPVLPLLRANCESNLSPSAISARAELAWAKECGEVTVQELDWYSAEHRQRATEAGPYEMLVAADCIYNEEHLPAFRDTCLALMTTRTTLVVVNELRSDSVQACFLGLMEGDFTHKKVLHSRMGDVQHPLIDIFLFRKRKPAP